MYNMAKISVVVGLSVTILLLIYPVYLLVASSDKTILRPTMMSVDLSKYSKEDVDRARRWPKVELHLHFDGSLSPEFISQRATARGIELPAPPDKLRNWLMEAKLAKLNKDENKVNKGGNWPVFDFCNQFLQTVEEITGGMSDLLARLAGEGVVYAEVRLCPTLHTLEGLTEDQVVKAALAGLNNQQGVVAGLVVVALRSKTEEHGLEMARLSARYLQKKKIGPAGVVGMDVAGDEGNYPLAKNSDNMASGVKEAVRLGVPLTLHAGEWPEKFGSVANLAWAVRDSGARRVGHGIAVRSAPDILTEMAKRDNITVEVCLTSNIGNGFKVANYSVHPAKLLADAGAKFSLSCDNLLLSGDLSHVPSPTGELLHLVHDVGLGWEVAKKSVLDGLAAAFSPAVDQEFIQKVKEMMTI